MEYQKITNLLDKASNKPSKFRTKKSTEINDESRGGYNVNSQIKFKSTILKYSLCDNSDAYLLVKGPMTVNCRTAAAPNNRNIKGIFKKGVPFTNSIRKINNAQVDSAKDIDIVMPVYNVIEYRDKYSKASRSLWQYCKDIPAVNNNHNTVNFNGYNAIDPFNSKAKITGQTDNNGEIDNVWNNGFFKIFKQFCLSCLLSLINCELSWLCLQIVLLRLLMLRVKMLHL